MQLTVETASNSVGMMNSHRFIPLYLFFFALIIRLVFLTATYRDKDDVKYMEDVEIAINVVEGEGYVYNFSLLNANVPLRPTALKPPVYPVLVSLVFLAFGMKNFFALFLIHAFLAAFTCALLYLAVAKFSHYGGAIAGLVFALYPPFIYHSVTVPESTTATLFLISLFCYVLIKVYDRFDQKRWIVVSIIGGLLAMTEPVTVPFIFLALLYVAYLTLGSWQKVSLEMVAAMLVFAATIAPWTVRNYLTFKQFVFIKSNFGSTLVMSGIRLPQETKLSLAKEVQGMDEVNEDKAIKNAVLLWILENPVMYLRRLPDNFRSFWWETGRYTNDHSTTYFFGRKLPYILLLIFSIPAMFWNLVQLGTKAKSRSHINIYHGVMFILIFTYTVIYTLVGAVNLRYHFPVEFGMFIFCADTILYLASKVQLPFNNSLRYLKTSL